MKCKYCGLVIEDDSLFCGMCGHKIEKDSVESNEKKSSTSLETKRLQKNNVFRTYQLFAEASNTKVTPEQQLIIAALTTLEWARSKVDPLDIDILERLKSKSVEEFMEVSLDDLDSFSIEPGYLIEVVCIKEELIWAFRLKEPDMGSDARNGYEGNLPVPGRIFDTNIAFRVVNGVLQVGIYTEVREPNNVTKEPVVFCPVVVKNLLKNENIGLKCGYHLDGKVREINSERDFQKFKSVIKDSCIPAVLFTKFRNKEDIDKLFDIQMGPINKISLQNLSEYIPTQKMSPLGETKEKLLFTGVDELAKRRKSFCHVLTLSSDMETLFKNNYRDAKFDMGDAVLCIPPVNGQGAIRFQRYKYSKKESDDIMADIKKETRAFMIKRNTQYGNVIFVDGAKERLSKESVKIREKYYDLQNTKNMEVHNDHTDDLEQLNADIDKWKKKFVDQQTKIDDLKEQIKEIGTKEAYIQEMMEEKQGLIDYYQDKLFKNKRPKNLKSMSKWITNNFSDNIFLTKRAKDELESTPGENVDIDKLCDAIEYLATEYWNYLYGGWSEEKVKKDASQKYGRVFEVAPNHDTSMKQFKSDYTIKYFKNEWNGKFKESFMDWHLKVGVKQEYLIRIYFLLDNDKKLIVIGSLPKHLKTVSQDG